jgi:hypothetical protein
MHENGAVAASSANGKHDILPSFFVVGPPRTGTTWLHVVLSQCAWLSHPTKETRFFDKYFDRGLPWYRSHYKRANRGRAVGEVAPTYFASAKARERIAQVIPLAKIVCTFRDPVERVLSLYRLKRAYGWISWTLEDALWRDPELMDSSRYAAHLREWIRIFGEAQVMATVHEDMKTDPQGYLDRIVEFVGAAPVTLQHQHLRRVLASEAMTQPRSYYLTRGALLAGGVVEGAAPGWNCGRRQENRGIAALRRGRSGISGSASGAAGYAARAVPAGGGATGRDVEPGFVGVEVKERGILVLASDRLSQT